MEWKAAFRSYDYVKKNENAIVFLDFNKETKVRSSKLTRDYTLLRPGKARFHPEPKETWTTLKFTLVLITFVTEVPSTLIASSRVSRRFLLK